jgi:hypothetical protein
MLNDVTIQKVLNGLNRPAPVEDSIFGYVMGGVSIVDDDSNVTLQYNTPYLMHGIEDAEALGLSAQYDTDNDILVYHHLKMHWDVQTGAPGQPVWLYIVSQSMPQTTMVDETSPYGVYDLINQCKGLDEGAIKVVACVLNPLDGYSPTILNGMDADLDTAIPMAQQLADALFDQHYPIDIILEGRNFGTDANTAKDLRDYNAENVSVVIAQDLAISGLIALHNGYAAVGIYMGKTASKYFSDANPNISLANSPAEVGLNYEGTIQNKANSIMLTYGMGNQPLSAWSLTAQGVLEQRHYVAVRIFADTPGVYFTQSSTCANDLNDIIYLELSRVYNKAARNLYQAYVPYINSKFKVDDNGYIPGEIAKDLEDVGNQAFVAMANQGDISNGKTYIDPQQKVNNVPTSIITTRKLIVKWKIIPEGKIVDIIGTLSFTVTL